MPTETLVQTIRTTPTPHDFALEALKQNPELSKQALGILWAHFAGETQDGLHCYGWNLGNVKYIPGCGYNYQILHGVTEFIDGKWINIKDNDPSARFRVYPSFSEGMKSFVDSKRVGTWRSTWTFVLSGNVEGYARELRRMKYYTAPLEQYVNLMNAKFNQWMKSTAYDDAVFDLQETIPGDSDLPAPVVEISGGIIHNPTLYFVDGLEDENETNGTGQENSEIAKQGKKSDDSSEKS